jgi:hypothetical protein
MKTVPGIRIIDNAFMWTYGFLLESEMFKRRIISVGPQLDAAMTIHAKLAPDWQALSKRGGTTEAPGPATFPGFALQLGDSPLKPLLEHTLTYAAVNYDVMGNPHPSPTRVGSLVVLLFLTSNWVEAMGGEVFFYGDESRGDIIQASSPLFLRAIVFDGAIPYTVRPPTRAAQYPKLTATFVVTKGPHSAELLGSAV